VSRHIYDVNSDVWNVINRVLNYYSFPSFNIISRIDMSCEQAHWVESKPIRRVMQLKLHKPISTLKRCYISIQNEWMNEWMNITLRHASAAAAADDDGSLHESRFIGFYATWGWDEWGGFLLPSSQTIMGEQLEVDSNLRPSISLHHRVPHIRTYSIILGYKSYVISYSRK